MKRFFLLLVCTTLGPHKTISTTLSFWNTIKTKLPMPRIFLLLALLFISSMYSNPLLAQHARCEIISTKAFLSDGSAGFVGPLVRTDDGGFIAHLSASGTKFDFNSSCVVDVVTGEELFQKYNADGTQVEWERCYSDTVYRSVQFSSIYPRSNGRFMLVGNAVNDTPGYGSGPGLRLENADHSIVWQHGYGGVGSTLTRASLSTADGGYVFAAETYALHGDVGTHMGSLFTPDIFVIKVDSNGKKVWTRNLGGTSSDKVRAIAPGPNGGYYITGLTSSSDGDFTSNHNNDGHLIDGYLIRLDSNGNTVWSRCFGGSNLDNLLDCVADGKGGVLAAGESWSYDGDIVGNKGGTAQHLWILRVDSSGSIIWTDCYGSPVGGELANALCLVTDNSYWIAANSSGPVGGDVDTSFGTHAAWILHMDTLGHIINQRVLGNPIDETVADVIAKIPGGVAVAGGYVGYGGNMPGQNWSTRNSTNGFFYRFSENSVGVAPVPNVKPLFKAYPNPVSGTLTVELNDRTGEKGKVWLTDMVGKMVITPQPTNSPQRLQLSCEHLAPGTYLLLYQNVTGQAYQERIQIK